MEYNKLTTFPPTLGFGYMRLPETDGQVDMDQLCAMADRFIEAGFGYFDTAWGYMDGKSEQIVRETVVERYARDRFTVATKFPIWAVQEQADVQRIFDTQLERTGAGYFDYYMIHAVGSGNIAKLDQYRIWEFLVEQRDKGLARHIGISFHDNAQVLGEVLSGHPEIEFVQLQINYADWEDEKVQARLCYEACLKYNKAVVIMEPVKGGSLATMSDSVQQILQAARPDDSAAAWAMRYCASLPGVITVLSGMSSLEQMEDNIKTMKPVEPITDAEKQALQEVLAALKKIPTVPCTACKYCVEECPQHINIPGIFGNYNDYLTYNNLVGMKRSYTLFSANKVKASDCIRCAVCEARCPQHIGIMDALADCAKVFEN